MLGRSLACLETLERSVSWDERVTMMEDFTSMLSSCSNGSLSQEMSVYSMWTDTIQMLYAVTAHRKRDGIMRRRMETLSLEDLNAQCERRFLGMAEYGLRSSYLKLERSFLKLARFWLHGHFCVPSRHYAPTPTGDIDPSPCRTSTLVDYRLTQQRTQSLLLGYHTLWRDLELVSQCCSAAPG